MSLFFKSLITSLLIIVLTALSRAETASINPNIEIAISPLEHASN
jgi:hypothetical protein